MLRKRLLISGKVQGVGFRFHSFEKAVSLKLKGWVQNLPDGRVEMIIGGSEKAVEDMISWSKKGPPTADVKKVEVQVVTNNDELEEFFIKREGNSK
jgi:acylphosphatase